MTPCCLPLSPALLCPARLTQGALQVAEGGAGQGLMAQRRLQQCPDMGARILIPRRAQAPAWLPLLGTRAQCLAPRVMLHQHPVLLQFLHAERGWKGMALGWRFARAWVTELLLSIFHARWLVRSPLTLITTL